MTEESFLRAEKLFEKSYRDESESRFVSNGRLEIIGNHTDHQHGHCIVATCSLGISAAVKKTSDMLVSIASDGYASFVFPAKDLAKKQKEAHSSIGLARGVLAYLADQGYKVGGFRSAIVSDIFPGAGVSSSAAYELFVAEVVNELYNEGKIPRIVLAKAGQYAENVYFGKASGLLDQCGSAFGGLSFLDLSDISDVKVSPLSFPPEWPLKIYLVNPGSSHAGLSDSYSEMPADMKLVANKLFGKEVLGEVAPEEFYSKIYLPHPGLSERAILRAIHYFEEDKRTLRAYEAVKEKNLMAFLEMERSTELSQTFLLKNAMIPGSYEGSPLEAVNFAGLALTKGAARVMGGGLVGTSINFVPLEEEKAFLSEMKKHYKESAIVEVTIPALGAHEEEKRR